MSRNREMGDAVYRQALSDTCDMMDAIMEHINLHRWKGSGIPPFLIGATTPIGRVQFVQYALRELEGIELEVMPFGRVGWGVCLIFPQDGMTQLH